MDKQEFNKYEAARASEKFLADMPNDKLVVHRAVGYDQTERQRISLDGATETNASTYETSNIRNRIASCREAYTHIGIIGNAVDLMVDFALEGLIIVHESRGLQRFFWQWAKKVQLGYICEQILKAYFRDSNVPVLSFRGRIKPKQLKQWKSTVAKQVLAKNPDAFSEDKIERRVIPYKYSVLDVLNLEKVGSELFGTAQYLYSIPESDKKFLNKEDHTPAELTMINRLRDAIGPADYNILKETGRLPLPADRLSMLYYKKDDSKRWANPMLWRCIDDLKFKSLLRDMDVSVAESVINTITIIALGDTPAGFPASKDMYEKMTDLLKTPTKSQTMVWNDLVKIIAEYPPVEKILGKEKYEQVDGDIRAGLGISEVLINGEGGNYSNSFLSVKTLTERLQSARTVLLDWVNGEITKVAQAMGIKKPAWVKMRHMDLTDAEAEKTLLLELVDRGMVSYRTCVERFGENADIEIQRMKEEDAFRRKNEGKFPYVLIKTGKFGPSMGNGPTPYLGLLDNETLDQRQTQDADIIRERQKVELDHFKNPPQQEGGVPQEKKSTKKKEKGLPTEQGKKGEQGGRPQNKKTKQQKKQKPREKPKGQKVAASCPVTPGTYKITRNELIEGGKIFDILYKPTTIALMKILGFNSSRQLKAQHREVVYSMITDIIGDFSSAEEVTAEGVKAALEQATAPAKLDKCVSKVTDKLVKQYKKKNGKAPSKKKRKELVSSAWAICRKQTGL